MRKKTKKRILISIILIIFVITSFIPLALTFVDINQYSSQENQAETIELTPEIMEQLNQEDDVEGIEIIDGELEDIVLEDSEFEKENDQDENILEEKIIEESDKAELPVEELAEPILFETNDEE